MRSEAIRPGDVIAGKYRVRTILGRSRGFLVEAFHTEFDQRVVIRVLSPAMVDEKEVERFRREARTLAKLESEHVAVLLVLQAAEAVAETHVHNILLRELQPSHLFVTQRLGGAPQVKIIDFGTA